jgi:hypothetical protein
MVSRMRVIPEAWRSVAQLASADVLFLGQNPVCPTRPQPVKSIIKNNPLTERSGGAGKMTAEQQRPTRPLRGPLSPR